MLKKRLIELFCFDTYLLDGAVGFVIDGAPAATVAINFEIVGGVGGEIAKNGFLHIVGHVFVPEIAGHRASVHRSSNGFKTGCAHAHQVAFGKRGACGVIPAQGDGVCREVAGVVGRFGG